MSAAVAKGVILSISIIAALGLAVYDNPQVQEWLEQQRRKIAELLRQIGEDLDPQSRRAAEAFAFDGRTPASDDALAREAVGSHDAAALATGRALSSTNALRRIQISGPSDPDEAEERRRKGREYLAQRNQQMHEMQQRRKAAAKSKGEDTPPTPTFDELVDSQGNLKSNDTETDLPSPPVLDPLPEPVQQEMREIERSLSQPIMIGEFGSTSYSGLHSGSHFANPFSDEHALERSITPKPRVPPKIELDRAATPPISVPVDLNAAYEQSDALPEQPDYEGLSYEEQLAVALSLSEQESSAISATVRRKHNAEDEDEEALRTAIAASLRDMDGQQAGFAVRNTHLAPEAPLADAQPLVDISPSTLPMFPRFSHWEDVSPPGSSQLTGPFSFAPSSATPSEASDELYRLTPGLTRARLATLNAQNTLPSSQSSVSSSLPFDPVRDAAQSRLHHTQNLIDTSFYSAHDEVLSPATHGRETTQLIDISEPAQEGTRTPTSRTESLSGFRTDSDSDTFDSMSAPESHTVSRPRSEVSAIEVVNVVADSDIDMLSEEGDGVATPDSWSEIESRDADSEAEGFTHETTR